MKPAGARKPRTLVIGYGNPMRGDDGLGRVVADHLARLALPGVEVLSLHQLTIDLAAVVADYDRVILIDAVSDAPPGEVQLVEVHPENSAPGMSHYVTPGELLLATGALYGARPWMTLVGVGAETFDGDRLSPAVEQALPAVYAQIERLVRGGHEPGV